MDQYRYNIAKTKHLISSQYNTSKKEFASFLYDNWTAADESGGDDGDVKRKKGQKDEKNGIRKSLEVDVDTVTAYVAHYVCGAKGSNASVASTMQLIQQYHNLLIMKNASQSTTTSPDGSQMKISTPPGIRNLGATCYLNSQLQCLVQNLGFLHGLLSWKPSTNGGSDRMNKVLSNMQSVLARMRAGPESVICTNEFAAALCLENDEMQDPNEESLRQYSQTTEQNRLDELLPSIFGGTYLYTTKCSDCGTTSERRENFMDISLPIVNCDDDDDTKKTCHKDISNDVDVKRCLDSYTRPEFLDGDNQYLCSGCNKKNDAVRSLVFERLPPVLNLQLARYVFDYESYNKKKISTKVLLPRTLEVSRASSNSNDDKSVYILCAVQNHLGTSAHGGHYVAECLDWMTGLWYEFNDDEVKLLENGPGSSFGEQEAIVGNGEGKKKAKVNGSADAFQLYYVEQSYLSRECQSELQRFEARQRAKDSISSEEKSDTISSIEVQRQEQYQIEAEFFSCDDGLVDLFQKASESSIIDNTPFLCEHKSGEITVISRLHPRDARKGKLLPQEAYDALAKILHKEYKRFLLDEDISVTAGQEVLVSNHVFKCSDKDDFVCGVCGPSYQREIRHKLNTLTISSRLTVHHAQRLGSHGKCRVMHKRGSVRLVPLEVWNKITTVFPHALVHTFESPSGTAMGNCRRCWQEKEEEGLFPAKLNEWKTNVSEDANLKKLLKRVSALDAANGGRYRVLHPLDVNRWRDAYEYVLKSRKNKCNTVRKRLSELLEHGEKGLFGRMICDDHKKAVGIPSHHDDDVPSWLGKVSETNIELVDETTFACLVKSLSSLQSIIYGDDEVSLNEPNPPVVTLSLEDDTSPAVSLEPEICCMGCMVEDPSYIFAVHDVDSGMDVDVAASNILADISSESTFDPSTQRKSRRNRKGPGDFPTYEVKMAPAGNLAHLRLLTHQASCKKLKGQRLFLLNQGGSKQLVELPHKDNATLIKALVEDSNDGLSHRIILTYVKDDTEETSNIDRSRRRKRSNPGDDAEEEAILSSLTDMAIGGWKEDGTSKGKKKNKRREERGFQGTFLQSSIVAGETNSSLPQADTVIDAPKTEPEQPEEAKSEEIIDSADQEVEQIRQEARVAELVKRTLDTFQKDITDRVNEKVGKAACDSDIKHAIDREMHLLFRKESATTELDETEL
eukprot:scaffold3306_cov287-Alexandrium_tamarense.AAC.1